jgi:hypothetical protein
VGTTKTTGSICAAGGWSEDGTVARHPTPAKDSEADRKDRLMLLDKCWVVGLEENVTNGGIRQALAIWSPMSLSASRLNKE